MSFLFADATSIEPVHGSPTWQGEIREGWDIADNANGGYLLALATRALLGATERNDPISVTAHYLTPGKPGPVTIEPHIHKVGRRFSTASGTLRQDDKPILTVLGTFGTVGTDDAATRRIEGAPPELPPHVSPKPEAVAGTFVPALFAKIDTQLHPDDAKFAIGAPSGDLLLRGWFALLNDEPIDTIGLLLAVDAFPPTAFNGALPVAWTPTLELTAHVRARPAPGPLACIFRSRFLQGSMLETDGEVWDQTGTLCAQSRQLALVPLEVEQEAG